MLGWGLKLWAEVQAPPPFLFPLISFVFLHEKQNRLVLQKPCPTHHANGNKWPKRVLLNFQRAATPVPIPVADDYYLKGRTTTHQQCNKVSPRSSREPRWYPFAYQLSHSTGGQHTHVHAGSELHKCCQDTSYHRVQCKNNKYTMKDLAPAMPGHNDTGLFLG